jgi:hypothetical protein
MQTKKHIANNFPKINPQNVKINPKNTVVGESAIYVNGKLLSRKNGKASK